MAIDAAKRNLLPESLSDGASQLPLSEFLTLHWQALFLAIRVNDPVGELAATLAVTQRSGDAQTAPGPNAIAYKTAIGLDREVSQTAGTDQFGVSELLRLLVRNPHFFVPLCKRSLAGTYAERISVGRARNKDIVLRHRSVSKFHAWFEMDEEGTAVIADAGSRNGTHINSDQVPAREPRKLQPGDRIRLGNVEAVLCPPELLWSALHPG